VVKLFGLTGEYCAGKNLAQGLIESRGIHVVDLDKTGHRALELESTKEALKARFGEGVFAPGGSVDRRALGSVVFSDPQALADLESITHPAMFTLLDRDIEEHEGQSVCINAYILHKMPHVSRLDFVVVVTAPYLTRLARARRRDGLPYRQIVRRFASQGKLRAQPFPRDVDIYTVDNRGTPLDFEARLGAVLDREGL
jgi:dephospho-CoA kinase